MTLSQTHTEWLMTPSRVALIIATPSLGEGLGGRPMSPAPRPKSEMCPVATELIENAPSLTIVRFPAFGKAIAKAIADLCRAYK